MPLGRPPPSLSHPPSHALPPSRVEKMPSLCHLRLALIPGGAASAIGRSCTAGGHLAKLSVGIGIQPIFVFQALHPDMRCPDMRAFSNSSAQSGPFFKFEQKCLLDKWEPWPLSTKLQTPLLFQSPPSLSHLSISLSVSTSVHCQSHGYHRQRKTGQQLETWQRNPCVPSVLGVAKHPSSDSPGTVLSTPAAISLRWSLCT